MATIPKLARLRIYPVKGLEGIDVDEWELDGYGLRLDRRWMVVDPSGHCISRREQPSLAAVHTRIEGDELLLSAPRHPSVALPLDPDSGATEPVTVGGDTVGVCRASDDASAWLRKVLRVPCRIVFLPPPRHRLVDPALGTREAELAFQDELPLQLLSVASLDDLNARLGSAVSVEAARPNLLIDRVGGPYEEDTWRRVRIGDVEIDVVKPWARNAIVDTDAPELDVVATLETYRGGGGAAYLGQLALHTAFPGTLRVGDAVEVLERGDPPSFGIDAEPQPEAPDGELEPVEPKRRRRRKGTGEGKKVLFVQLPGIGRRKPTRPEESGAGPDPWEPEEVAPPGEESERTAETEPAVEASPVGELPAEEPLEEPEFVQVATDRIPEVEQTVRLLAAAAVAESTGEAQRLAEACVQAPLLVTAWRGEALVGLLRGWTDGVRDGFIADVAVHPDQHGSGTAEELVRRAVALHPAVRWVLRASQGSAYLGSALGWQHAGSGWYLSPR